MIRGHLKHIALAALEENPLTGYDLMKILEDKLGRKPSPGSVYPVMAELESVGFVKETKDGRRNVYKITTSGKKELGKLNSLKHKLIDKMGESVQLCGMLTGADMRFYQYFKESLSKGELPLKSILPESMKLKQLLAETAMSGTLEKETDKIREILEDTNNKLQSLIDRNNASNKKRRISNG